MPVVQPGAVTGWEEGWSWALNLGRQLQGLCQNPPSPGLALQSLSLEPALDPGVTHPRPLSAPVTQTVLGEALTCAPLPKPQAPPPQQLQDTKRHPKVLVLL